MNATQEFDRQVQTLISHDYPKLLNLSVDEFIRKTQKLKKHVENVQYANVDIENGTLPFVIVVSENILPLEKAMKLTSKEGKEGVVKLNPLKPSDFDTTESVKIPDVSFYLLHDIDRGKKTINIPPSEAMDIIVQNGRSPLTIAEGIALITHHPDFLMKNNCFSLLASRHEGDKRVPAIWINGQKQPNLGWCWNGNPHTWLGSASCKERLF